MSGHPIPVQPPILTQQQENVDGSIHAVSPSGKMIHSLNKFLWRDRALASFPGHKGEQADKGRFLLSGSLPLWAPGHTGK